MIYMSYPNHYCSVNREFMERTLFFGKCYSKNSCVMHMVKNAIGSSTVQISNKTNITKLNA